METLRFGLIGRQDIRVGTGTFEVELADGRIVTLQELSGKSAPSLMTLPSYTLAGLPTDNAAGTAGRAAWVTDDSRDIRLDVGTNWASAEIFNVKNFGAKGDGVAN